MRLIPAPTRAAPALPVRLFSRGSEGSNVKKKPTWATERETLEGRILTPVLDLITTNGRTDTARALTLSRAAGLDPAAILARAVAEEAARRVLADRVRDRSSPVRDISVVLLWRTCGALRAAWRASWTRDEKYARGQMIKTAAATLARGGGAPPPEQRYLKYQEERWRTDPGCKAALDGMMALWDSDAIGRPIDVLPLARLACPTPSLSSDLDMDTLDRYHRRIRSRERKTWAEVRSLLARWLSADRGGNRDR